MPTPRQIRVEVACDRYSLDGKLTEVIAYLHKVRLTIPEEYRDSAFLDLNVDDSWGSASVTASLCYFRPQTEEEQAAEDARNLERNKQHAESLRKQLAALAAKGVY